MASSQIYLFHGEDDFSLRQKIHRWKEEFAKKYSANAITTLSREDRAENEMIKMLDAVVAPSLFSSKKLIIAKDFLPSKASESKLGEFLLDLIPKINSDTFLVFWETGKPDKRLGLIKKIFSAPINVNEFNLPQGRMLNGWIRAYAKILGVEMEDAAIEDLAVFVGRDLFEEKKVGGRVVDRKEAYDLWQVHSELNKLAGFTNNIKKDDVRQLVKLKVPENVFVLTDELANKNQQAAFKLLEQLLDNSNVDEKAGIIKIIGLLAENIRGLLLIKVLKETKATDAAIADRLGWSSGRVFVTVKQSQKQDLVQLKKLLVMLSGIDLKLKNSDQNPRLLINQFIVRACQK